MLLIPHVTSDHHKPAPAGRWDSLDATSVPALVAVAIAGSYGVAVLNLLPALVSAWIHHLGLSEQSAGAVATVNIFAHAVGMLAALVLVSRWPLPRIAYTGLVLGIAGELSSIQAASAWQLVICRALEGAGLGLQFGAVINWFGRNRDSARGFGIYALLQNVLLVAQFLVIPPLESAVGGAAIYLALIPLALAGAACMVALNLNGGSRPLMRHAGAGEQYVAGPMHKPTYLARVLALLGFGVFSLAMLGVWGFMQQYGEFAGLTSEAASQRLALAPLGGIPGALIVAWLGGRFGRLRPLAVSIALMAALVAVLASGHTTAAVFTGGLFMIGLNWTIVVPYFQDLQSALDKTGRLAVVGTIVVALAAAAGPGAIGLIIRQGQYRQAFVAAVVVFVASLLISAYPARVSDRAGRAMAEKVPPN
jgi:MFS family permease